MKIGSTVIDRDFGQGIVKARCGDVFTVSFTDKVRYYYGNGTELGSRMLGDRHNALDANVIKANHCSFISAIRGWLSRTAYRKSLPQ